MKCENCGKEHDGTYGSGRFCSKSCAKQFSTKNYKKEYKSAKCIICGKDIFINKMASTKTCKCDDCTNCKKRLQILKKEHQLKYLNCKICGSPYLIYESCKNKFCQEHNIQQIKSLIKYFNFDETTLKTNKVETEFNRIRDILYDLYWNKHKSSSDICKIYNYPNICNLTGKIFKYLNIPTKSCHIANIENIFTGKLNPVINNQYKSCWHTTWNNKEVYLRSSYELDYAKELDEQQIDYEVESLRIKYWNTQEQEYKCAIPDFYLPKENMIVEIKSSWTLDEQQMKDKMKEYKKLGYNCKLICDHKLLNLI